ncbi:MAG: DUF1499 domain-containing protein [Planctomycetota bacterium]
MFLWIALTIVVVSGLALFGAGWWSRRHPGPVGLVDGELRGCPSSPNCVRSEAGTDEGHRIEPFAIQSDPQVVFERFADQIAKDESATIVKRDEGYLHVEYRSPLIGFVDDLELRLADDVIHVRSASRVGHSDLGANRRRVEALRKGFESGR